eukprot:360403-Chlamydomonas_euryale.AAC.2
MDICTMHTRVPATSHLTPLTPLTPRTSRLSHLDTPRPPCPSLRTRHTFRQVNKEDLLSMVRYGAELVFSSSAGAVTDADIDAIITKGERDTAALNNKMAEFTDNAMKFTMDGGMAYDFKVGACGVTKGDRGGREVGQLGGRGWDGGGGLERKGWLWPAVSWDSSCLCA